MDLNGDKLFQTFKQLAENITDKNMIDANLELRASATSQGENQRFDNLKSFVEFVCSFRPLLETKGEKSYFEEVIDNAEQSIDREALIVIQKSFDSLRNHKGFNQFLISDEKKDIDCWEIMHRVFNQGSVVYHAPRTEKKFDENFKFQVGMDTVGFFLKMTEWIRQMYCCVIALYEQFFPTNSTRNLKCLQLLCGSHGMIHLTNYEVLKYLRNLEESNSRFPNHSI